MMSAITKLLRLGLCVSLPILLLSCAGTPVEPEKPVSEQTIKEDILLAEKLAQDPAVDEGIITEKQPPEAVPLVEPYMSFGSGQLVNPAAETSGKVPAQGDVTLNFENADLREIIKVVFEEILGENYLIDPKVQGTATIHTTRAISHDEVLPVLESVLQSNGAALVREGSLYKVISLADVKKEVTAPSVGRRLMAAQAGYGTHIIPLKYIAATEIKKILESINKDGASVQVDASRNILILSGNRKKINNLLETIRIFDVDWLKGMSFGLFPLQYADATILADEISQLIGKGKEGPLAGIVRLIPIERLNSLMVITHRPHYLDAARNLIEKFDRGTETGAGRRLYVYNLENGKADNIAGILQDIFGQEIAPRTARKSLASAQPSERIDVRPASDTTVPGLGKPLAGARGAGAGGNVVIAPTVGFAPEADRREGTGPGENLGTVTIIADQDNNAILILATPTDYRVVESAIRRLDIAPHQVLIEATIAEVTLTDNLSYGVRWFFDGDVGNGRVDGGFNAPLPAAIGGSGFTLGIFDSSDQMKVFFDILETETTIKFLSAPQVMVIDNQTASIRVGDQIPIVTRSSQSTGDSTAPLISEVQFRDTGTLLSVTPSINVGGRVTLEISQEVSIPGTEPAVGGGGNVPIAQRTIDSTVMVHSGQTVVLGGLIRETATSSNGGIPVLKDIPVLGKLFSSTTEDVARTELIVTITPRVVRNQQEAEDITDEFRHRVKAAYDLEQSVAH